MTPEQRKKILAIIAEREKLRPLARLPRLIRAPLRTLPYYVLAALSHLRPFPLSFKTLWGTTMTSYLPEGNTFYYYGYCEANVTSFFLRHLKEKMVIIDVGAHVGIYTMLAAELVGSSGEVHSFEPTPSTYRILEKNTSSLKQVKVNNLALSDKIGTVCFMDYGAGYSAYNTASTSGGQGLSKTAVGITVPTTTLNSYCIDKKLKPSLIKLDAEGFESAIIRGTTMLISKDSKTQRPLIILEVAGGTEWDSNRKESFALLENESYSPYTLNADGTVTKHTYLNNYTYDNLLFVPPERMDELLPLIV